MISHDVFIARRTMVFSATMVFFLSLGRIDHFVTRRAFPPRFAFRPSLIFGAMSLVTLLGQARHVIFLTRYRFFRFGTVHRFTHDAGHFAFVFISIIVVFQAGRTKVSWKKILSHWKSYGNGNRRPSRGRRTVAGRYSDS